MKKPASPSATGPSGELFEGRVAAHYLLTMLAEAEPRGFPGMIVHRVEMQRRGEGYPLDDVIVHGITKTGDSAVIEVQVKRTAKFSPANTEFKEIVLQITKSLQNPDFLHERHQFAVAIGRTSFRVAGPYQDVLRWAREIGEASTFIQKIKRKNVGNDDMRNFVKTFRSHLKDADYKHDDETVWQILRRFHILIFDYDAPSSQSLELALERAQHVLEPEDASRAGDFWKTLTETAIQVASSGGDRDRNRLLAEVGGFHVRGSRRNRKPRETLLEEADFTAADLQRKVAGVALTRTALLEEVRNARDASRHIEIRGEPGVGKSGLLSMLVKEALAEACVIVLTPQRTIPGGWPAFKSRLGVDGNCRDFLADLASDGGAVLFVDSLDFFDDRDKRATVIDLVRSAAEVLGFQVIVTARTEFGKGAKEPNWLPLEGLGPAKIVTVNELNSEEIEELKGGAPALRALLADGHPAREIVRNLFRLSWLLGVQGSVEGLRSEGDLLKRWWETADGATKGRRDRKRLLVDLSDEMLKGNGHLETRASSIPIEALIESGTLHEIGDDRFAFRHDILRDWGVAGRLYDDLNQLDKLTLTLPTPASLERGVELAARLALEHSGDGLRWIKHLNQVNPKDAHPSWRRLSLLAILRSELAPVLLDRVAKSLFNQDGALLRELIRTAIAVESRPFVEILKDTGHDASEISTSVYAPTNFSWYRLAHWLSTPQTDLPVQALPEIIEFFQRFSMVMFHTGSLTPKVTYPLAQKMATTLANWIDEIEDTRNRRLLTEYKGRFATAYRYHDLCKLANDVRHAFAFMASCVPERAGNYLRSVMEKRDSDDAIKDIMQFGGTFAHAAPTELVELTLTGLTAEPLRERSHLPAWLGSAFPDPIMASDEDRWFLFREDVLTDLDDEFQPSSPTQGPFLALLNAAPTDGLALIQRLVDHAVTVRSSGRKPRDNGLTLFLPSGRRFFPWQETHYWSRDARGHHSIESALMALEAWSHARIEQGDSPEQVIDDILGPEGTPAAFVLVATDILISHWPKTLAAITPFLGSPELLSLDRIRQAHDSMPKIDLFGWWGVSQPKEPSGSVSLASLRERTSRRFPLETLLGLFTHTDGADLEGLRRILGIAAKRLGPPDSSDTFADPRFMVRHALNMTDMTKWKPGDDGWAYTPPPDEAQHIAEIQAKHARETADSRINMAIWNMLDTAASPDPEFAEHAIAHAKRLEATDTPRNAFGPRTDVIVSAAMIVARDGADELLAENERWVRKTFMNAFAATGRDFGRSMHDGIHFNPVAIATLGIIHLWRRLRSDADRDLLLALAGREDANSAQGFAAGLDVLLKHDRRLIPAALRCALSAQIRPKYRWDDTKKKKAANLKRYQKRVKTAIHAERAWLRGKTEEPGWPLFPSTTDASADELDTQCAALWLRQLMQNADEQASDWLPGFMSAYAEWTAHANGSGRESHAEIHNRLNRWNHIFFHLLACAVPSAGPEWASTEVARATAVPDKSFFEIATNLVPPLDELYFNDRDLDFDTALALRDLVAKRLMESAGWKRERDKAEISPEMWIGSAIGTLFFNHYSPFSATRCYLSAESINRIERFFPQLACLIEEGPVPLTALLTMNLLEVSPRPAHAEFFLSSALTWLRRQPSNAHLWVDHGLGTRLARWIESVTTSDASLRDTKHTLRPQIDEVLGKLVQTGVSEAHRVERFLASD